MPMLDRELNDDDALREMARVHGRAMTSVIRVSERDPGEVEELGSRRTDPGGTTS